MSRDKAYERYVMVSKTIRRIERNAKTDLARNLKALGYFQELQDMLDLVFATFDDLYELNKEMLDVIKNVDSSVGSLKETQALRSKLDSEMLEAVEKEKTKQTKKRPAQDSPEPPKKKKRWMI